MCSVRPQYAHSNDNDRLARPLPQVERTDHRWIGTLELQVTATTQDEKEVCVQVMAIKSKGNRAHLSLLSIEGLACTHPSRLTFTSPRVLSLEHTGPAVSIHEFRDWVEKSNPVMMQVRPAPGTNDHSYGSGHLGERPCRSSMLPPGYPLTPLTVWLYWIGDSRHGPVL